MIQNMPSGHKPDIGAEGGFVISSNSWNGTERRAHGYPIMNENKGFKLLIWGCFAVIGVMLAWPVLNWVKKGSSSELTMSNDAAEAFNSGNEEFVSESGNGEDGNPELYDSAIDVRYQSKAERESAASRAARERSTRQETAGRQGGGGADGAGRAGREGGAASADQAADPSERQRERAFIRRHAKEIKAYQSRLQAIGRKYMAKYPSLRKMDSEFGNMPRYMALCKQYEKDRNAYNWARGVMTLPEVRGAIIRYSANAEVVRGIVEISMEAMKSPPPQAIQSEIKRFMTEDMNTATYVNDLSVQVMGNAMAILPTIPGQNLAPLQKLGNDIMGGNTNPAGLQ